MKRCKTYLPALFFLFFSSTIWSQGIRDALRYSFFEINSTARSVGVGNSLGALGADFSVASTNPAGMAMFRSSEMLFSPGFRLATAKTELTNDANSRVNDEGQFSFHFNTLGIAIASQPQSRNWRTSNFAIGFNRISNLRRNYSFEGNSLGSITDRWLEIVDSGEIDAFEAEVALDAEAVFDFDNDGIYETDFIFFPDTDVPKSQTIEQRGSINEIVFTFAGNYNERLMIGATLGVPFVSYQEEKTYTEVDEGSGVEGDIDFFEDLEFQEFLTTTGVGINLKLGLIYRINQMIRVGFAAHTPSAFSLEDNFSTSLSYNFISNGERFRGVGDSPDGNFSYRFRSPWRFIGSLGALIQKQGFVSAEVELVNYGAANFRFDSFDTFEGEANAEIAEGLQSTLHFRLGGEYAYDVFRFRAGVGLQQSPVVNDDLLNTSLSAGVGVRKESFYFDIGYKRTSDQQTYIPYLTANAPQQEVDFNFNANKLLMTLGFKF